MVAIALDRDGFHLPAEVGSRGQTAFLRLCVRATAIGRLVDPFIEVSRGRTRYRQYFERGATGQRHLNLSPIVGEAGEDLLATRVHLRGSSITWRRDAELEVFESPLADGARSLVLAPHPDDAEIAAFGLYSNRSSWVATITAGDLGAPDLSAVLSPGPDVARWSAILRVWDSLTIPRLGDVSDQRCVNLVYPDGRLKDMYDHPSRTAMLLCEEGLSRVTLRSHNGVPEFRGGDPGCTWSQLVGELRLLLEKTNPDIVVCPHPLLDEHEDHIFATVALEEAVRGAARADRLFFLYVVHCRGAPIHPFGPADTWVSPSPWSGDDWVGDSIYSHPLAESVRVAKYFAIEAAHGLRTYSAGEPRTLGQVLRTVKGEAGAFLGGTGMPAASFLRRAPRPNEIYYVVSSDSLSELVQRALGRRAAGASIAGTKPRGSPRGGFA